MVFTRNGVILSKQSMHPKMRTECILVKCKSQLGKMSSVVLECSKAVWQLLQIHASNGAPTP
jgi:hypothetical protein